jgi:Fe-S-cluster containining protein
MKVDKVNDNVIIMDEVGMNVPQMVDFLEDVKQRVRERLHAISVITEEDIDDIVKASGGMTLTFLKKLTEGDLVCEQCGTCCQKVTPISITEKEIRDIAKYLNISPSKLRRKYNITYDSERDQWSMPGAPCPFLKGKNTCTIYPVRMHVCREFPFNRMYEEGTSGRRVGVHPTCPMVREAMARFYIAELVAKKFRR